MTTPLIEFARTGRSVTHLPLFDAHAHVGGWRLFDSTTLEQRVAMMERTGIRVSVVSSLRALAGDIVGGNDEVLDAMDRYPTRFLGYVHVSANYPELIAPELARCFQHPGMRGIKVYQNGIPYDDARFTPVWEYAAVAGVPVLAHTWGGALTGFDAVAAAYPTVAFLAAHAGSDFAYQPYLEAARRAPNLYLDLTYSREHTGMIEHFVATLGAQRLVWGTDEPLFSMAHQLSKVLFARISDEEKTVILCQSARLFGQPPSEESRNEVAADTFPSS